MGSLCSQNQIISAIGPIYPSAEFGHHRLAKGEHQHSKRCEEGVLKLYLFCSRIRHDLHEVRVQFFLDRRRRPVSFSLSSKGHKPQWPFTCVHRCLTENIARSRSPTSPGSSVSTQRSMTRMPARISCKPRRGEPSFDIQTHNCTDRIHYRDSNTE